MMPLVRGVSAASMRSVSSSQVIERRFHRHRHQSVIRDSQESCDVSIGRHHDFVALGQSPQFFVSANNQTQCVESVSRADTFRRTYILCIMFLQSAAFRYLAENHPLSITRAAASLYAWAVQLGNGL